jgi:hypothetical protein
MWFVSKLICCVQLFVIPAQAGIQEFNSVANRLDTRFRGYDDFLLVHQGATDGIVDRNPRRYQAG